MNTSEETGTVSRFPARRGCPFAAPSEYAEWREHEPAKPVELRNGSPAWVLTRHSDLKQVLASTDFSTKPAKAKLRGGVVVARGEDTNLLYMDQPMHSNFRKMLVREFSAKRVNELRPEIEKIVDQRIDAMIDAGGPLDLVEYFCLPVPSMTTCQLMGVPWDNHEAFEHWSATLTEIGGEPEVFASTLAEYNDYMDRIVREKTENPGSDILSRLVTTRVRDGEMTHEQVVGFAMLLLIAGHETTATQLGMGFVLAMQNPEIFTVEGTEDQHWSRVVEEMLRISSISDVIPIRTALTDVTVAGQKIKAGDVVVSTLAGANFDPDVFDDPEKFDPSRDNRNHVAFASGLHSCLGQSLARAELVIAFSRLFKRLPGIRLTVPVDSIQYKHDQFTFGPAELPVTW